MLHAFGIVADIETADSDLANLETNYGSPNSGFFLLFNGSRIIGTAAFKRMTRTEAEICRMYLSPYYRGKGIGKQLLQHVTKKACSLGVTRLIAKTALMLKSAIGLYEKGKAGTVTFLWKR